MNENPDETKSEGASIDDPIATPENMNDSVLQHDDRTFQPEDTSFDTDMDFTRGTTEMPESEIEPPTVGDAVDGDETQSTPTFSDDTLDEPRDEVDLMGTASAEAPDVPSDDGAEMATGRTPFHASEIHQTTQPRAENSTEGSAAPENENVDSVEASEPSDATLAAATLDAEPATLSMSPGTPDDSDTNPPLTLTGGPNGKKGGFWGKKRTILAISIVVVLALIAGGAAFAYTAWYQAPSKVMSDAVMNLISAKSMTYSGTVSLKTSSDTANVSFNGGVDGATMSAHIDTALKFGDTDIEVPVDIVGQSDTVYFKLSNLQKLESQFVTPYLAMSGLGSEGQKQVDALVKSIDGTWYKVTPSDLNESDKDKQTNTCVGNVVDKIRTDHATQNELMSVYKTHPLFTYQKSLGSKDGSLGYELRPVSDKDTAEFANALKDTSIYKSLVKCDSSLASMFDSTSSSDTTPSKTSVQIWVSRWGHQITKITASDNSDGTQTNLTFVPKVGDETSITIPNNAKSIDDLKKQFTDLEQSLEAQMTANTAAEMQADELRQQQKQQAMQQTLGQGSHVEAIVQ